MPPRKRPEIICPPDHDHGLSSTCRSAHGCVCPQCRARAVWLERKRVWARKHDRPLLVDATGTHRRIRALQVVGYSYSMIAARAGHSESWVGSILRNRKVTPETAALVDGLYRRFAFQRPAGRDRNERAAITKTRNYARSHGFRGPLDWERIDTDPEPEVAA